MAAPFPSVVYSGSKVAAESFVNIRIDGLEKLLEQYKEVFNQLDPRKLRYMLGKAASPIVYRYQFYAGLHDATGNLEKATKTKFKHYGNGAVMIAGPQSTGTLGATGEVASGNHAWLVEFGSRPRRPGSSGRRTYINTHQTVNMKMSRRPGVMSDADFFKKKTGVYFLMSSKNEPTRQARKGSGYTHDFLSRRGKQVPMTLHSGETYGQMPALGLMKRTVQEVGGKSQGILEDGIRKILEGRGGYVVQ